MTESSVIHTPHPPSLSLSLYLLTLSPSISISISISVSICISSKRHSVLQRCNMVLDAWGICYIFCWSLWSKSCVSYFLCSNITCYILGPVSVSEIAWGCFGFQRNHRGHCRKPSQKLMPFSMEAFQWELWHHTDVKQRKNKGISEHWLMWRSKLNALDKCIIHC